MAKFDKSVLATYGIQTGTAEVLYNPSYEVLFNEETKEGLTGFDKAQETELGAVNVMTGIYTGRSPKDKFIVDDETSHDTVWWDSEEYHNDNHRASKETWDAVKEIAKKELSNKKLYVVDGFCGTHRDTRMKVRFIMENMPFFISPPYHVLMMTCSLEVTLKTTAVSEWRPSSFQFSTFALEAL